VNRALDIGFAIVLVAAVFVMVRPGSQGPSLVSAISNGFVGALRQATGGGTF